MTDKELYQQQLQAQLDEWQADFVIVRGVDALGGSRLLDIKPYAPVIDSIPHASPGHVPGSLDEIAKGKRPDA